MNAYRSGMTLRLTDDGRRVTVWSPAPGSGSYWAHVHEEDGSTRMVKIRVVNRHDATTPEVKVVEE